LSQYELRTRLRTKKLKDADDTSHYVSVFEDAHHRFLRMGVAYMTEESIFDLLQGLPDGVEWEIFQELTLSKLSLSANFALSTPLPGTAATFIFEDAAKSLSEKANAIIGRRKLAGPGSEYSNAAVNGSRGSGKVNPSTGIRVHRNNPRGVKCTNGPCVRKSHAETHDADHCYWPRGGMEDKAPSWIRGRAKDGKTEVAAVASAVTQNHPHWRDLSCAAITELDQDNDLSCLLTPHPSQPFLIPERHPI
jgi:hypothetical protein